MKLKAVEFKYKLKSDEVFDKLEKTNNFFKVIKQSVNLFKYEIDYNNIDFITKYEGYYYIKIKNARVYNLRISRKNIWIIKKKHLTNLN